MSEEDASIAALIALHDGLDRQGPGDDELSRRILQQLPELPAEPAIADLGCGAGAASLLLAAHFNRPVTAVDLAAPFLERLQTLAGDAGLADLIRTCQADFGNLDWPDHSIDLLWSEGAAYHLTFAGAIRAWRPLLTRGGVAVLSEATWFTPTPPEEIRQFWQDAYPSMGDETTNIAHAEQAGLTCLATHRLPSEAWWPSYYTPLMQGIETMRGTTDPVMQSVIAETEREIDLFRRYAHSYGYTYYVLMAPE